MAKEGLYMLAIMPPPGLAAEIEEIRHQFANAYNCKAALKPPVHITLIPPFKTADTVEEGMINTFEGWASEQQSFDVELKNFDAFRRNQVVFIHVEPGVALRKFQKELQDKFKEQYGNIDVLTYKEYNPHITIGYRDIPRALFRPAAIEYLAKTFSASFPVEKFYLWKHNTINWQVLHTFHLRSQ